MQNLAFPPFCRTRSDRIAIMQCCHAQCAYYHLTCLYESTCIKKTPFSYESFWKAKACTPTCLYESTLKKTPFSYESFWKALHLSFVWPCPMHISCCPCKSFENVLHIAIMQHCRMHTNSQFSQTAIFAAHRVKANPAIMQWCHTHVTPGCTCPTVSQNGLTRQLQVLWKRKI